MQEHVQDDRLISTLREQDKVSSAHGTLDIRDWPGPKVQCCPDSRGHTGPGNQVNTTVTGISILVPGVYHSSTI